MEWRELEGRLFAYASPEVLIAMRVASDAGIRASTAYNTWWEMAEEDVQAHLSHRPRIGAARPPQALKDAAEAVTAGVQAANNKDDAFIEAIRVDLLGEKGRAIAKLREVDIPADPWVFLIVHPKNHRRPGIPQAYAKD